MRRYLGLVLLLWACAAHTAQISVYFSPWDDAEGQIVQALRGAREQVRVQAYLLTSRVIARELLAARQRGVDVAVLADAAQAARGNDKQLTELAVGGVPVHLETAYNAAHNKVMIIDAASAKPVLITGSYNFTWSAQARNAENLLVVRGDAALARRYLANWQRHREAATAWAEAPRAVPPAPTF